jgi:pantothenate kinase
MEGSGVAPRPPKDGAARRAGAAGSPGAPPASPESLPAVLDHLRERNRGHPGRLVFGFAGPPGSGKSTVVARLATALGDRCAVVPMDGFHLANRLLAGTPLAERKGAIDTFDAHGFLHLVQRLRAADEPVVYAPAYERTIEEPVAGAIPVPQETPIVLLEGNYLLADAPPWNRIRDHLDGSWFIHTPRDLRLERLIRRHRQFGKTADEARAWAMGPDETNATFIEATRQNADHVLHWT